MKKQAYGGRPSQKHILCAFDGCTNSRANNGLCGGHHAQRRKGYPLTAFKTLERHPTLEGWSKPYIFKRDGYAYITRIDSSRSRQFEHRVVMEQMIGRELFADENVHHLNGVRSDNRPQNLELWSHAQPRGQRIEDKLAFAYEMIARYASGA